MDEQFPNDPRLESLAARLSSLTPQLGDDEQRELLYECGFTAGANSSRRREVRWRTISTVLAASLCTLLVATVGRDAWRDDPTGSEDDSLVTRPAAPAIGVEKPPDATADVPREFVEKRDSVRLDAWAHRSDPVETFSAALARFRQLDPAARSLSVTEIQRSL